MDGLTEILRDHLEREVPVIIVTVDAETGSAPREAGAAMLVSATACHGTVGGGRLEFMAIERARAMLDDEEAAAVLDLPLGPSLGQCCGGRVMLDLRRADDDAAANLAEAETRLRAQRPTVFLFGAGHVGQALSAALAPLPLALTVIDTRPAFLDHLPAAVARRISAEPVSEVAAAPPASAFVVMTHSHALDYEITAAALDRGDAAYVGLIGSRTKRARFERWYERHGSGTGRLAGLTCPIGGNGPRDKRPSVIAALVAAEIVSHALADPADIVDATRLASDGGTGR